MNAIDTNILVRFLVQDDKRQCDIVYRLFKNTESKKEILFVSLLVVLELIWVLESVYEISRSEILEALRNLLAMSILKFEKIELIQSFLSSASHNSFDLSDLLIAHSAKVFSCERVYTFDKKVSRYELFQLLK